VDDILVPPLEVSPEGWIHLPDGPGMGYRVDRENMARYRIQLKEFPA
jgi:L-alanine-DL-glutamate epimerase-like enolase superfamily enzyme